MLTLISALFQLILYTKSSSPRKPRELYTFEWTDVAKVLASNNIREDINIMAGSQLVE